MDEPLGLGYRAARRLTLDLNELGGYDRDLRELYTKSRSVRDEIFSQRYRLKSLEQEQERATMTFRAIWRPNATMQRELQELRDRVTTLEQERDRRGQ
ncbi:hypothetical protein Tco_0727456 [Tanacetum coccineum]|uniref:Uncharacterized protein n=1 Tax=Tanacetum coccineum TaxID=301880 RepID=A0ABQ4YKQ0_9ASTR